MIGKLLEAIEQRTGAIKLLDQAKRARVRGGPSWGYVLGTTTLVLFLVLLVTGLALAAFYSPSVTDAWASIAYLEREIPLGRLLRAIHLHAHSAIVIAAFLHLARVIVWGAYRAPRELTHLTGLALLLLIPAFSLTGYILPYDQTAYWATKVRMGIVGSAPVLGELQTRFLLGGNDVGNLSLTRMYALHVIALPLVFLALSALHLALFRRHGATPRPSMRDESAERRTVSYWPSQAARDAVAALFAIVLVLAVSARVAAPLGAPADPATSFVARPEWYFLFLFQLLKYFQGPLDLVGKVVAPALAVGFLAALPFLDRAPSRQLRERRGILGVFALGLLGMSLLAGLAVRADAKDPALALQHKISTRESERARQLAAEGVPVEGAALMAARDPLIRGERIFWAECASCHPLEGVAQKPKAPELTDYLSKAWIRQVLRDPDSHRLYGLTKVYGMEPVKDASEAELTKLVDFVYALRQPTPPTPESAGVAELLDKHECTQCHELNEDYGLEGPALFRYGSEAWVRAVVEDAGADHLFGKANTMPVFRDKLSSADLAAVTKFLLSLEGRGPAGAWPHVFEPAPTPRKVPTSTVSP